MCRLLPLTKILHCPQCIKTKINLSIKGRSYLKHLFIYLFEISFTPANVISPKKNNNKRKRKRKRKRKTKGKKKKKKIQTNMVQLHKAFSDFT